MSLSQLIAYVNFQSRVLAGLRMLKGARMKADARLHPGELDWRPWIAPLDLDAATEEQLAALKVTPSNRAVGAYSLVLAHDPEALSERSPLYNGIMFGAKGLPRAERELGAVAASRINGCAYCASVHALRFTQLTKAAGGDGAHPGATAWRPRSIRAARRSSTMRRSSRAIRPRSARRMRRRCARRA